LTRCAYRWDDVAQARDTTATEVRNAVRWTIAGTAGPAALPLTRGYAVNVFNTGIRKIDTGAKKCRHLPTITS
jgi:hypothetical protein